MDMFNPFSSDTVESEKIVLCSVHWQGHSRVEVVMSLSTDIISARYYVQMMKSAKGKEVQSRGRCNVVRWNGQ